MKLIDIQSQKDSRKLTIDKVGIKGLKYPILLKDKIKGNQHTISEINMYVQLPHNFKGTHMSRFLEILNEFKDNINILSVKEILNQMRERLDSDEAHIEIYFPYFITKKAPVSKQESIMSYECAFYGSTTKSKYDFIISVKIPVLSLCPCSKEISKYGAHNQRSYVTIKVRSGKKLIWIEDIIEIAEKSASSPIYSLLKREDEKYVTEKSYENPVFVEDIVRNAAEILLEDKRIIWFEISSENFESIHNHSAFASITRKKEEAD
jgi:GTP cyclohydrolase I